LGKDPSMKRGASLIRTTYSGLVRELTTFGRRALESVTRSVSKLADDNNTLTSVLQPSPFQCLIIFHQLHRRPRCVNREITCSNFSTEFLTMEMSSQAVSGNVQNASTVFTAYELDP